MIQIQTAAASRDEAERIGEALVEKRLAACAQVIGPMQSTYRWQGKIEHAVEWLSLIKTRTELYQAVEDEIRSLHSYETPEIIASPVVRAAGDYLAWVYSETKDSAG